MNAPIKEIDDLELAQCPGCLGSKLLKDKCPACKGDGLVVKRRIKFYELPDKKEEKRYARR